MFPATPDARIKESVNGNNAPLNHNEQEIAGYRDALDEIHFRHDQISLSETVILHIHELWHDRLLIRRTVQVRRQSDYGIRFGRSAKSQISASISSRNTGSDGTAHLCFSIPVQLQYHIFFDFLPITLIVYSTTNFIYSPEQLL